MPLPLSYLSSGGIESHSVAPPIMSAHPATQTIVRLIDLDEPVRKASVSPAAPIVPNTKVVINNRVFGAAFPATTQAEKSSMAAVAAVIRPSPRRRTAFSEVSLSRGEKALVIRQF